LLASSAAAGRAPVSEMPRESAHNSRFFFSSRRRHTSWPRDWSSDVCSSDLGVFRDLIKDDPLDHQVGNYGREFAYYGEIDGLSRSEERRVGKECRSRGWLYLEGKEIGGMAHERWGWEGAGAMEE